MTTTEPSDSKATLVALKGAISSLSTSDQITILECAKKIRDQIKWQGANGVLALGLVGATLAAEQES